MQVATRATIRTVPGIAGMGGGSAGSAGSTGAGMGDFWEFINSITKPLVGAAATRIQTQPGATVQYDPRTGQPIAISQQSPGYPILTGTVSGAGTLNASPGSGTLIVLGGVALLAVILLARR